MQPKDCKMLDRRTIVIKGLPQLPDRRLLGFEEEFTRPADAEAVVRRLGGAADFQAVFVDFVVVGRADLVALPVEMIDQAFDGVGSCPHRFDDNGGRVGVKAGGSQRSKVPATFSISQLQIISCNRDIF